MNKQKLLLSVSIDLAKTDEEKLAYIRQLEREHVEYLHIDIKDGILVPQTSYSFPEVKRINSLTTLPLDVHLMVAYPDNYIKKFAEAGANIITIHKECFETREDLIECLKEIRRNNALSGIAISLETNEKLLIDVLPFVDFINVMGVPIGESGQKFDELALRKIQILDEARTQFKFKYKICLDGGVTPQIASEAKKLGVDMVVSSSFLYESQDRSIDIKRLRQ